MADSRRSIIVALLLLFVIMACSESPVYFDSRAVAGSRWHMNDTIRFEAGIADTTLLYQVSLSIRNTTDYPYSNLFMFMDIGFPDGTAFRDTLECILALNDGKWTGKGFGKIRENIFLFRDNVWFPDTGMYTFSLVHGMRQEELPGVADVGLRIDRK